MLRSILRAFPVALVLVGGIAAADPMPPEEAAPAPTGPITSPTPKVDAPKAETPKAAPPSDKGDKGDKNKKHKKTKKRARHKKSHHHDKAAPKTDAPAPAN